MNKRNQEKPNQFSKFRIASISKPMTAVANIRRGEKTIHKKWDYNIGILSGDLLMIIANKMSGLAVATSGTYA